MGRPQTHPVKKLISLTPEQAQAITDYRFDARIPSENEAIRDLIEKGLSVVRGEAAGEKGEGDRL